MTETIDCRGLTCPEPILRIRLRLNRLHPGDELTILSDDPTFHKDFLVFCRLASVTCLHMTETAEGLCATIRVNPLTPLPPPV